MTDDSGVEMNEGKETAITAHDFHIICRACLRFDDDMVDIFGSGMGNRIMEVTNLKVASDDELPKSLCQACTQEMDHLVRFFQQVKSSDAYLRSLLSNKPPSPQCKTEEEQTNVKKSHSKKLKKTNKKLKHNLENDEMYLILVPNINDSDSKSDGDICIKDLNSDTDNTELSNYCKALVQNYCKEKNVPDLEDVVLSDSFPDKVYTVNLDVFRCGECGESFDNASELRTHISSHDTPAGGLDSIFTCPVCDRTEREKTGFLNHLRSHRGEGVSFVRVNSAGEEGPVEELADWDFKDSWVFRVNLGDLHCTVCSENIKSRDSITDHFNKCLSDENCTIEYSIRYSCPVCYEVFFNEEEDFTRHLGSHRLDNVHYLSVNGAGQPVDVEGSELFLPFELAKLFHEGNIVKIEEVNSCERCEFEAETHDSLREHRSLVHPEEKRAEISLACPVCREQPGEGGVDEEKLKLYEHLKVHRDEGVILIRVQRNGALAGEYRDHADVFTQSPLLLSLLDSFSSGEISTPELCISRKKTYTCDVCEKEFRSKKKMIKHSKTHQASRESSGYVCEKCGKKCSGRASYRKHFLMHSEAGREGRRPTCTVCGKTFASHASLNGHLSQHAKEGTGNAAETSLLGIMCEKCGKRFLNNSSLGKHKKLHQRDKENAALKCEICDKGFFRQSSFDRHRSAHLNPRYFECNICKFPLSSVLSLQKHLDAHRTGSNTFDCKGCKISFLTKDSLTAHQVQTGHYLDRKPLECNVCHEKFYIGRKFTEHIKSHPKYKMGECTLCGKRLSTIQSLMLHMGRHFESNSILCPHCGKQFFEEKNYHRHLLSHEGIKPFACDFDACEKSFYTLYELNRHKKYHNNTRNFRCPYCSKGFHEANHLTVHVRTHTGERPYTCPHCNKGFITRTRCKHHIKLVHQGIGYDLIRSNISKKVAVFEAIETTI